MLLLKLSNVVNLFIDEGRLSVNKKMGREILAKFFPAALFRTFLLLLVHIGKSPLLQMFPCNSCFNFYVICQNYKENPLSIVFFSFSTGLWNMGAFRLLGYKFQWNNSAKRSTSRSLGAFIILNLYDSSEAVRPKRGGIGTTIVSQTTDRRIQIPKRQRWR